MNDTPQQADKRYRRFLQEAQDSEKVWGLFEGAGWANWSDEEKWEGSVIPFWSSEQDAKACAIGNLANYRPRMVMLDDFLDSFLPDFEEHGFWVGLNLSPQRTGVQVPPAVLREELNLRIT